MADRIYADNAATTQLDRDAFESMAPWLLEEYGNASQPYAFARKPKLALAEARQIIATCINALPEEIYFTSGGTESDNWAIKGSVFSSSCNKAIVTSAFEHHAVLRACKAVERLGYPVAYMWPTKDGVITTDTLKKHISCKPHLVSVMIANNEIGSIQPVKELCVVAHANGALFHTDAVQAVGHIKIDVRELGVDMLSASAHKFNGPKGVGFLFIRKGTELPPYMDGGAQEMGHRAGTENIASIVGMATALKINCDNLEQNRCHQEILERRLLRGLKTAGVAFSRNGGENILPGLLSLSFAGQEGEAILHRLDLAGICISTGSACNSTNTEISHVLQAIGLSNELAAGTIRISLGRYNTEDDVDRIVKELVKIVKH